MKKVVCLILCFILSVSVLSGCGASSAELKNELCGTWEYVGHASLVNEDWIMAYEFKADNTVDIAFTNLDSPEKSSNDEGAYKISNSKITVYGSDGDVRQIIEYTYTDGVLSMIATGPTGNSVKYKMKKD